ncbi:ABC transporter permease [Hymenobacter sp. DH14]|uniref:ABC transporter permease n=1 Tax=Hymenobacter cyanobacteriorum TaxID=2926463 RepID=A0A9X1VJH2_9BACT|nr:ABC transporter permease [Hymenobacter cyanobacteriorum]MCI1189942.1 ABC transporter permease [Hymenobacter cyanobacteriorum]
MGRLLLRHLGQTLLGTWLLASAVFLLSRAGSDQVLQQAFAAATEQLAPAASAADVQASRAITRHRLGLDQPLFYVGRTPAGGWQWRGWHNQYHQWLQQLSHGSLGTSFRTGEPVTQRLARALALTLPLTIAAAVLAALAALALAGWLAAAPRWQLPVRSVLVLLQSMPLFVIALALLLLLANPEALDWFPANGLTAVADAGNAGRFSSSVLLRTLPQLVLPITALVLSTLPELTLQLDAALSYELRQPYILTAKAKGLQSSAVVYRHALRNALLPTLAQLAELLPAVVAGAVVVEVIFTLPGMGRLLAEAAAARDYPVLVGGVLLVGTARLVSLLLADLSYSWADPRIRWQA